MLYALKCQLSSGNLSLESSKSKSSESLRCAAFREAFPSLQQPLSLTKSRRVKLGSLAEHCNGGIEQTVCCTAVVESLLLHLLFFNSILRGAEVKKMWIAKSTVRQRRVCLWFLSFRVWACCRLRPGFCVTNQMWQYVDIEKCTVKSCLSFSRLQEVLHYVCWPKLLGCGSYI